MGTTLAPGRNVAIDRKWGSPNVVHDGVTVAKEIELEDLFENMGAQLVKEAAEKPMIMRAMGQPPRRFWPRRLLPRE